MSALRHSATAVALGLLLAVTLCLFALGVTIQGGTGSQRHLVESTLAACWLPTDITDGELRGFGPVTIEFRPLDGNSGLSRLGLVYIDTSLAGLALSELAAHEWAHQIWYSLGPKWWAKWAAICGGNHSDIWTLDFAENFAECAKVSLFPTAMMVRPYAVTDLRVTPGGELKRWLTLARYANNCPFDDLGPGLMPSTAADDELAAAGGYIAERGLFEGRIDGRFHPAEPLTKRQLALICGRAGYECPSAWLNDYGPATRGEVRDYLPLHFYEERWEECLTRGQLARLLWRAFAR